MKIEIQLGNKGLEELIKEFRRKLFVQTLHEAGWNLVLTSVLLHVDKSYVYSLMYKYNLTDRYQEIKRERKNANTTRKRASSS